MSIFDNIGTMKSKAKIVKIKATDIEDIMPRGTEENILFDCDPGDIMLFNQELIKSILLKYAELDTSIHCIVNSYISLTGLTTNQYISYKEALARCASIKTFIITFIRNYETYIDHGYTTEDMSKVISITPPDIKAFECCIDHQYSHCDKCIFHKINNITKMNMLNICFRLPCVEERLSDESSDTRYKFYYFRLV